MEDLTSDIHFDFQVHTANLYLIRNSIYQKSSRFRCCRLASDKEKNLSVFCYTSNKFCIVRSFGSKEYQKKRKYMACFNREQVRNPSETDSVKSQIPSKTSSEKKDSTKDAIQDTTSDGQVNSCLPLRRPPASPSLNIYFTYFCINIQLA